MKTIWVATYIIGLAVFVTNGVPHALAQFEVDPDHYETREPGTSQQSKNSPAIQAVDVHYKGNFTLPYTLECNGRKLPPGKYSVSLESHGRTARVAMNGKGQSLRFQGMIRSENSNRRPNALVVWRKGELRELSLIQVAKLDVVFDASLEHRSVDKPNNLERVALIPGTLKSDAASSHQQLMPTN